MQGIQKTIYALIKANKTPYITRKQINAEMAKTSFGDCLNEGYKSDEESGESKFERRIDQALCSLRKGGWIAKYNDKKAKYKVASEVDQAKIALKDRVYKPKVCQALVKKNGRPYCPVRKMYMGDPKSQCELIYGTDTESLTKKVTPMKSCYFNHKPTNLEIELAQSRVQEENTQLDEKLKLLEDKVVWG